MTITDFLFPPTPHLGRENAGRATHPSSQCDCENVSPDQLDESWLYVLPEKYVEVRREQ